MKRFIPLIVTLFFVGCGVLYSPDIPVSTLKKTYANEHSSSLLFTVWRCTIETRAMDNQLF